MENGSGLAEALLGLDGFRVLAVQESPAELVAHGGDDSGLRWLHELWCARRSP